MKSSVFGPISNVVSYHSLTTSLWQKHFLLHELTEIVRQQKDPEFASILSRIRFGEQTEEDCKKLEALEHNDELEDGCLMIFCLNVQARQYNEEQLEKLNSKIYKIESYTSKKDKHTGRVAIDSSTVDMINGGGLLPIAQFAVGAQYMHLKNTDLSDGLANGATGKITHIEINESKPLKGTIFVRFYNSAVGKRATKTSQHPGSVPIKAVTVPFTLKEHANVHFEQQQYPGMLAYGLTVHKAQGDTYEQMIAHIRKPAGHRRIYTCGQIYTMLSRAKTRQGLKIVGFDPRAIVVSKKALAEMKRLQEDRVLSIECPFTVSSENYNILIGHLNVRSLGKHYEDLRVFLRNKQIDVLCLTETHVHNYNQFNFEGFDVFPSKSQCGCAIYTSKTVTQNFEYSSDIETTAVLLDSVLVVCVYVPPGTSWEKQHDFFSILLKECAEILDKHHVKSIVVTGDFNSSHTTLLEKISALFLTFGISQYILSPTQLSGGILDLMFTNTINPYVFTVPVYFSDHHFVAGAIFLPDPQ